MAATLDRSEAVAIAESAARRGQIRCREQDVIDGQLAGIDRSTI
jgi:hypothetical protein